MGKWNINIYWSNQREKHPLVIQNKYFFELKIKYLICKFFVLIRCFIIYTLFLLSIWVLIKTRRCKLLRSTTDKWMLIKVTNIGHWWVCAIHYQLRCKVSVFFLSLITAKKKNDVFCLNYFYFVVKGKSNKFIACAIFTFYLNLNKIINFEQIKRETLWISFDTRSPQTKIIQIYKKNSFFIKRLK